jgi:hypothetical protein
MDYCCITSKLYPRLDQLQCIFKSYGGIKSLAAQRKYREILSEIEKNTGFTSGKDWQSGIQY